MAAKVKRPGLETPILTIVKGIVKLPLTPSRHPSIIQPDGHFVQPVIRLFKSSRHPIGRTFRPSRHPSI